MLVATIQDLTVVLNKIQSKFIALDTETTGLDLLDATLIGFGLAVKDGEWYISKKVMGDDWPAALEALGNFLCSNDAPILISHNASFDMHFVFRYVLKREDLVYWSTHWWDTLSMAALVDENLIGVRVPLEDVGGVPKTVGALSLKALSHLFLGRKQRLWDENFTAWSDEEQAEYGCADVRNCYDLAVLFSRYLKSKDLLGYYREYVAPMSVITYLMESRGIHVDVPTVLGVQKEVREEIQKRYSEVVSLLPGQQRERVDLSIYEGDIQGALSEIVDTLPREQRGLFLTSKGKVSTAKAKIEALVKLTEDLPFWKKVTTIEYAESNPNSYQQLAACLLEKGYRLPQTQTGNFSVSSEVLGQLAAENPSDPLWKPLFEMRTLEKLEGTYVSALLEMAWEDGTVHPEWNQTGTVTGRYSTSVSSKNGSLVHKRGPALQTIPRPDTIKEAGWPYNPRQWFVAPSNCTLCVSDLSQAEVRMLAAMSQDPVLIQAICSGEDIHASNAEKIVINKYGAGAWDSWSDKERKTFRTFTKTITFGVLYGMGPNSLSDQLKIPYEEAVEWLDDFYATFTGILPWKRREQEQLTRFGYVTTWLGRRRSPILLQSPPRITAEIGTPEYTEQKLMERLWQAEYDLAMTKSGFDDTTEEQEIVSRAARQAINFEIQGSVAELINKGLVELNKQGYDIRGQIHDEVIISIPDTEEEKAQLTKALKSVYEVEINGVPFVIDVHFGSTWAAGKE